MRKKYQQFILRLTVISLITGGLCMLLKGLLAPGIISPALPWLIIMFYIITAVVHFIILKITLMNPRKFVGYFMLSTFLKLFIYLVVIVAYVFIVKEGLLPFILAFFALYIIYTVFEVVTILNQTKKLT
jgi:hypothetical protein